MDDKEELIKSLKDEIKQCEEYLSRSKEINELVAAVQKRKEEAEARLEAIQKIPHEILDEVSPQLRAKQEKEKDRLDEALPVLPKFEAKITAYRISSGSTSADRTQVLMEHLPVEEQEGAESLVLSGGGDIFLDGQVGEKGLDLGCAHPSASSGHRFGRVTHAVEMEVAFDPADVGLLGVIGVVFALLRFALGVSCDSTGGGWHHGPDPIASWGGALPWADSSV